MVPLERAPAEQQRRDEAEHHEADDFLNDLELDHAERSAVVPETDAVRGNLSAILKKSDTPAYQNNREKAEFFKVFHLTETQMAVPRYCHKGV